jgi:hypothetical protein
METEGTPFSGDGAFKIESRNGWVYFLVHLILNSVGEAYYV